VAAGAARLAAPTLARPRRDQVDLEPFARAHDATDVTDQVPVLPIEKRHLKDAGSSRGIQFQAALQGRVQAGLVEVAVEAWAEPLSVPGNADDTAFAGPDAAGSAA